MSQSGKLFTFNDIVSIEDQSLQKILYEIDNADLADALVPAGAEIRNKVFGNVSERRAIHIKKRIEEKVDSDKNSREETQQKIISVIQYFRDMDELVILGNFMFPGDSSQSTVESLVKHIEEACEKGYLSIPPTYNEIGRISENDVREAFAAFQNRRNELARIKDLSIKGKLLTGASSLLEMGNINELEISDLTELPGWICDMQHLEKLSLFRNDKLKTLPDSIGNLQNLKELDLALNENLETLPDSVGNIKSLTTLSLYGNGSHRVLPSSIGKLQFLTQLSISYDNKLKTLPDNIGDLQQLTKLSLYENKKLKMLPESICSLRNLTILDLHNSPIEHLPISITNLTALKRVNILGTHIHSVLGFLSSIEEFIDNKQIEIIPQNCSLSYRDFVNSYYRLLETIYRCIEKAKKEGLLSLEDDLEHITNEDFFSIGMKLVLDGTYVEYIQYILTISIEREQHFYRKRLMEIALEGILGIQTGESFDNIAIKLNSMVVIKNNPINAACAKYINGDSDAFKAIDFQAAMLPEKEREEFHFIKRALKLNEIAYKEGLLALENHLDNDAIADRDVFEYGLLLAIDNYDCDYFIEPMLTELLNRESDPVQKNIALAKKAAVMFIMDNPNRFAMMLFAHFDKDIIEAVDED